MNISDGQSAPLDNESADTTTIDLTLENSALKVRIPPTSRAILHAKTKLLLAIPKNTFDGLKVSIPCYVKLGCDEKLIQQLQTVINEGGA